MLLKATWQGWLFIEVKILHTIFNLGTVYFCKPDTHDYYPPVACKTLLSSEYVVMSMIQYANANPMTDSFTDAYGDNLHRNLVS
jgi:hypothetical protein